jgi:hypothetical protein
LQKICADKSLLDKIQVNEFKLKSKGLLNINKAKITVEENFTDRQFNDNELKKLNSNLNSLVLYGKLEIYLIYLDTLLYYKLLWSDHFFGSTIFLYSSSVTRPVFKVSSFSVVPFL